MSVEAEIAAMVDAAVPHDKILGHNVYVDGKLVTFIDVDDAKGFGPW